MGTQTNASTKVDFATQSANLIKDAHETVTVEGKERSRALRNAALDAVCKAYGPFTIVKEVALDKNKDVKFAAWVTGARGFNGAIVKGKMGEAVTGWTTVQDFADRGMITNPDKIKGSQAVKPSMRGILG